VQFLILENKILNIPKFQFIIILRFISLVDFYDVLEKCSKVITPRLKCIRSSVLIVSD
jgi:hypothetical protein